MTYENLAIGAITAGYLIANRILNETRRKTIDNFVIIANENLIPKGIKLNEKLDNIFQNLFKKIDNYISP